MAQLFIRKSIHIEKEPQTVFQLIHNFHNWLKWSPWLIADPNADIKIDSDGKFYKWDSPILGSGQMKLIQEENGETISCELQFLKPWKSKARVYFFLNKKSRGTEVIWTMKSKLPFYLFWLKKKMEFYIGEDYQRGLLLLKDLAENQKQLCKLNFQGIIPFEHTYYIGVRRIVTVDQFKEQMANDFKKLSTYLKDFYQDLIEGSPFTIYHQFKIMKNKVEYTIGYPIKHPVVITNQKNYFVKSLPKMKAYSVVLTGSYKHLPTAWAAQMMHQRSKKFKSHKKIPPFEIYLNDPMNVPEAQLKTKVMFPVTGSP